jgi:hypothetical protein
MLRFLRRRRPSLGRPSGMLLIDAANVVGSHPGGWWRDRPAAARDLVERVAQALASGRLVDEPVVLVLEGQARAGWDAGPDKGLSVVHAPGSGDDMLVDIAATAEDPVVARASP